MPITHLTLKLGTFKVKVTDKGHDGKNSSRSIYIWSVKELLNGLGTMKLNANNKFILETWNLQGQGHRQRSQLVELIKVYLHLKFERGIVNGHSAMKLNAITDLTLKLGTFKVKVIDKGHNG